MLHTKECPLQSQWILRGHYRSDTQTYKVNHVHLMDLDTIGCWVGLSTHLRPGVAFCTTGVSYAVRGRPLVSISLFRDGIRPEWEDTRNDDGFNCTMRSEMSSDEVDALWDALVMELVRGGFCDSMLGVQLTRKICRRTPIIKFDVWIASTGSKHVVLKQLNSIPVANASFSCSQRPPPSHG